ncbi:MAG: hypothetical protein WAM28_02655 [Chlamydiales bacterium]
MPRKNKIITIFHLCCAFSYLSWLLFQPYAREVVVQNSKLSLFERVLGHPSCFQKLSLFEQQSLVEGYKALQSGKKPSYKPLSFLFTTPPFALAWLFFSIFIPLLLLFRVEGAHQSVWLLPLFVVAYAYFSYKTPTPEKPPFFPSKDYVITNYLDNDPGGIFQRHSRLLEGWHRYLIAEWAHEDPSRDSTLFEEQLDRGLFAFNVERLKQLSSGEKDEVMLAGFIATPSLFRFLLYLTWNLIFAWTISRKKKRIPSEAASAPN